MQERILFECVIDEAGIYLQDPTPEVSFWYEMPVKFWKMLIDRYKEISKDNNFTPGQRSDAENLVNIIKEEIKAMKK